MLLRFVAHKAPYSRLLTHAGARRMTVAAESASAPAMPPSKVLKTSHGPALLVKRLSEHAVLPKRGSVGAAGYDLAR